MKNGLMVYQSKNNHFNIGDYIQSLAAKQFFHNRIDKYVCREDLHHYSDEDIKLILNGWFMNEPEHWPPSSKIHPLFISFHVNAVARKDMLNEKSIDYYKKFEPIGCRDLETIEILKQHNVKSYFSGCLTLTLANTYKSKAVRENHIYFVDPYYPYKEDMISLIKLLPALILNLKYVYRLAYRMYNSMGIRKLLHAASFYRIYSKIFDKKVLLSAEYIRHQLKDNFNSENEKFEYAERLLIKYSGAKLIVTSRIHCALPSLAFNTPVIFIDKDVKSETSECRLKGLRELFLTMECKGNNLLPKFNLETDKITLHTKIVNKENFQSLIDHLNSVCKEFCNT